MAERVVTDAAKRDTATADKLAAIGELARTVHDVRDRVGIAIDSGAAGLHPDFETQQERTITNVFKRGTTILLASQFSVFKHGARKDQALQEDTLYGNPEDQPRGLRVIKFKDRVQVEASTRLDDNGNLAWDSDPSTVKQAKDYFFGPVNEISTVNETAADNPVVRRVDATTF